MAQKAYGEAAADSALIYSGLVRKYAIKWAGAADKSDDPEGAHRARLVATICDDGPHRPDVERILTNLIVGIDLALAGHPDAEALRRIAIAKNAAAVELGA